MTDREKLIEILSEYFSIGDSDTYCLTRSKEGFVVGTVTVDDFQEFDEENVADLADHILKNNENEVTLKLDLGDRSAEEILQIAEAFVNETTTAVLVPSNESEIRKQVAKDILQEFWHIERGQTELDNVCIRIADKFGLLKELQGEYRYEKDKN